MKTEFEAPTDWRVCQDNEADRKETRVEDFIRLLQDDPAALEQAYFMSTAGHEQEFWDSLSTIILTATRPSLTRAVKAEMCFDLIMEMIRRAVAIDSEER